MSIHQPTTMIDCRCTCGRGYRLTDQMVGKKFRCKGCGTTLGLPSDSQPGQDVPPPNFPVRSSAAVAPVFEVPVKIERPSTLRHLTLEELRDPRERIAFRILILLSVPVWLFIASLIVFGYGIPLLLIGVSWIVIRIGQLFTAAYIKTNAIHVSPTQLPKLHAVVNDGCRRLQVSPPDVYVIQHGMFNAFAAKLVGRRLVILLSGAIDPLLINGDYDQLAFIVGHEIGHHIAGHLDFLHGTCSRYGAWLPWFHFWYHRRRELTCDRIGLYCTAKLDPAIQAMIKMTVGAQLAQEVNVDDAIRQWEQHRKEFFVRYRTIYSTHPHHLWRLAHLYDAAREFGVA
jgi:Zn-dependent protease with chaperone function